MQKKNWSCWNLEQWKLTEWSETVIEIMVIIAA